MRLLGRGGMGEVYVAEDTRKHRVVALKLISPQFTGDPVFRTRMQREADTAGRLTEPHVVPIHDYGEIDGRFYVEMRLIDGTDLRSLLRRYGPLAPARAVALVRQVAAALDAAHGNGVTHRDVKPENILVTDSDFAYLVDFGIARAATDPGLTQTGTALGTYNYMAPERFTGDEVTYRADIYALACVLGECLTGSPPYRADSIERMVAAHLMEPAPRPSQLRPGHIPVALDDVIARGMAKNPRERYSSAGELAAAAHDALTAPEQNQAASILRHGADTTLRSQVPDDETRARPAAPAAPAAPPAPPVFSKAPRGKRKLLAGAAALLLLVVVIAAGVFWVTRPSGAPSAPSAAGQSVLPFDGLTFHLSPGGVTLDGDGNVYVTNQGMYGRVVKLAPGSSTPTVLPFTGLYEPQGVAVDSAGTVYVSDFNNRVVKLTVGSNSQTELPLTGLTYPEGVTVDIRGNVYVADRGNDRVVKFDAGSDTQTVLPFTDLDHPDGVAVDNAGNVYVTDSDNNRVLKLAAGSNAQTVLPFTGLAVPWGIAVDGSGSVYVTEHENHKVVKLPAGSDSPIVLPFRGLNTPLDVTVGADGSVYVADRGNNRVVRLAADAG
jgi:serine/threonine-protein kinase